MDRRAMVGGAIIAAWVAGLAVLVRREYYRPALERLALAANRVTPGAVFFGVMRGGQQLGFASSTIDTASTSLSIADYLVADAPAGSQGKRTSQRTNVTLSRSLRMTHFDIALESDSAPVTVTGVVDGDTAVRMTITSGAAAPRLQRIMLSGPALLPILVPLAVVLTDKPKVGNRYNLPVLDPTTMRVEDVTIDVRAESLFVLNDSSVFDSTAQRWRGTRPDTVRAWQLVSKSAGPFDGWIDDQGRVVEMTRLGFMVRRQPYEVAFENWASDPAHRAIADDRRLIDKRASLGGPPRARALPVGEHPPGTATTRVSRRGRAEPERS